MVKKTLFFFISLCSLCSMYAMETEGVSNLFKRAEKEKRQENKAENARAAEENAMSLFREMFGEDNEEEEEKPLTP